MVSKFIQEDCLVLMNSNPNLHWIYLIRLLSSKQMKTRLRHQDLNDLSNSGFSEHFPHAKYHSWLNSIGVNMTYPWLQGIPSLIWLIWLLNMNRWGFFRCSFTKSPALEIRNKGPFILTTFPLLPEIYNLDTTCPWLFSTCLNTSPDGRLTSSTRGLVCLCTVPIMKNYR